MTESATTLREVSYLAPNGTTLQGYLATPSHATTPLAGIIVCPEWWGLTDYPKQRARQLAEAGYAAFAIDVYGEGKVTTNAKQAKQWMEQLLANQDSLLANAKAGLDTLAAQPEVDDHRLAAIGFCFGGKIALDMARAGYDLKAVVSFHGTLTPKAPAQPDAIKAEVLVLHGEQDTRVTLEAVEKFKQEMDAAHANYQVIIYPDAKHAFTNPVADQRAVENNVDLGYNAQAAEQSNQAMLDLFKRIL